MPDVPVTIVLPSGGTRNAEVPDDGDPKMLGPLNSATEFYMGKADHKRTLIHPPAGDGAVRRQGRCDLHAQQDLAAPAGRNGQDRGDRGPVALPGLAAAGEHEPAMTPAAT